MSEVIVENKNQLKPRGILTPGRPHAQNLGRPVLIFDEQWNGEGKPKTPRERIGTFHIWGYSRKGGRDVAPSMETVAVIELEDGRITTKRPDQITFMDRAKQ